MQNNDWEKEFDDKFVDGLAWKDYPSKVKSFISQEIDKARESSYKQGYEDGKSQKN